MTLEAAFSAHQGGREEQQDHVAVLDGADDRLLVVADGMGGHAGGQIASRALVETARRLWDGWDRSSSSPQEFLDKVMATAHEAINRLGEEQGLQPRSTCVMLYLGPDRAVWGHIGDSRLYRFNNGELIERTRDHSVPQMLLEMGKIEEDEVATHPDQNRLTQSLGGDTDPEPDFGEAPLTPGDAFLLCSDGLWERVRPERMSEMLYGDSLDELVRVLPQEAYDVERETSDNISVAVARVDVVPGAAAAKPAAVASAPSGRRKPVAAIIVGVLFLGVIGVVGAVTLGGGGTSPPAGDTPPGAPGGALREKPPATKQKKKDAPDDLAPAKPGPATPKPKAKPDPVEAPPQKRAKQPPAATKTPPAKKSDNKAPDKKRSAKDADKSSTKAPPKDARKPKAADPKKNAKPADARPGTAKKTNQDSKKDSGNKDPDSGDGSSKPGDSDPKPGDGDSDQ